MVTPLKTFMGFLVHLNVQLIFYNLPNRLKRGNTVSIGQKWPGYNGTFVLEDNADPEEITLAKRSN